MATHFSSMTDDNQNSGKPADAVQHVAIPGQTVETAAAGVKAAADFDHSLTAWQALKLYPKAALFSCGICLSIIMEGYDTGLMGNFFGVPPFRKKYGQELDDGDYQLSASWQSSLGAVGSVGGLAGLLFAGWLVEEIGYRKSMFVGLTIITGAIFIPFFAPNVATLLVGQFICGFPWGMFQGMTTAYAADIAPLALRAVLTSYINLCWTFGAFICTGVLRGVLQRTDQWAYRIPFAIQWIWPIPITLITLFAPESPWWLIRRNRKDDARKVLRSLARAAISDEQIDSSLELMCVTNRIEMEVGEGTSYLDLLKGVNLRRTEISVGAYICQVTCGTWFGSQIVYFMEQAGASPSISFAFGLGVNGVACLCTISSWFITPFVGRRTLYVWGLFWMLVTELIVGFLYISPPASAGWIAGAFLILNDIAYYLTLGPICYIIVPEAPSTRLRIKTVAVARGCYSAFAIMANVLQPYILNPTAWNLKGKGGFIWGALCLLSLIWAYIRLPEMKGRSAAELDILFEERVATREFAKKQINFGDRALAVLHDPKADIDHVEKI